jgi:hypothetical protein
VLCTTQRLIDSEAKTLFSYLGQKSFLLLPSLSESGRITAEKSSGKWNNQPTKE